MTSAFTGLFLAASSCLYAEHHETVAGAKLEFPVTSSSAEGATLWDFHGNKIGEIETILLAPGDGGILAVIDTSILEEDRKLVVPWNVITVKAKNTDKDDVVYAMNATKAQLIASPAYNGEPTSLKMVTGAMLPCCTYWSNELGVKSEEMAEVLKKEAEDVVEEVSEAVKK